MTMADHIDNTRPAANDDTMNLESAADFLHLGYLAMKELVDTGEVPALRCNQKHTVMLRADLVDYVRTKGREQAESRRRKGTPPVVMAAGERKPRRGRIAVLPDLSMYELATKDAPQG